jgi:hypothetical protein
MDYGLPRADGVCSFEMDENTVPTLTNPLGVKVPAKPAMSARGPRS